MGIDANLIRAKFTTEMKKITHKEEIQHNNMKLRVEKDLEWLFLEIEKLDVEEYNMLNSIHTLCVKVEDNFNDQRKIKLIGKNPITDFNLSIYTSASDIYTDNEETYKYINELFNYGIDSVLINENEPNTLYFVIFLN